MSNNIIAISGYSLLLAFSLYKLGDTMKRPADLTANLLLVVGLSSLIAYHARLLTTGKAEDLDPTQKSLRLIAHSSLVSFLLITLSPLSLANFQFYDWFALLGHSTLFASVSLNLSQIFGVGMLAIYFLFATAQKFGKSGPEIMNFVGRALLLVFFVVSFTQGIGLA
jgi:hypothetical protein